MEGIEFHLQAEPRGGSSWCEFSQRVERMGFAGLRVPDHPGSGASPFVALAAAAAVTERITLAPYVLNAGVWDPLILANEVATLDIVSDGRAVLGIGAGHTPSEWLMRGAVYPSAAQRVDRLVELIATVPRLLTGETVDFEGQHVQCRDAALTACVPVQTCVPVLIGGNGPRVLELARKHANIVSISGLGATRDDGHSHSVRWSAPVVDRSFGRVDGATRDLLRDVLVQHVAITNDRASELERVLERLEVDGDTNGSHGQIDPPYLLVATIDQIATQIEEQREKYGIRSYTVRAPAMKLLAPIVGDGK